MLSAESPVVLIGLPSLLLALTVYLSRPTPRRIAGALAAGVVVAVVNALVDVVAYAQGWWRYPTAAWFSSVEADAEGLAAVVDLAHQRALALVEA